MATGRLGAVEPAAATDTSLYAPGSGLKATCIVTACNRSASAVTVRIALVDGAVGDIADEDYLIYERSLAANGDADGKDVLQLTGIVVGNANSDRIVVRASAVDVSFTAMGIEEAE